MQIVQLSRFHRHAKKLHKNERRELDEAVAAVMQNTKAGELKLGDLSGVRVYKFRIQNQLTLLAYEFDEVQNILTLIAFGSHENFYRDLKRD